MSVNNFILRFSEGKLPEHIERPAYESIKHSNVSLYLNSNYSTRDYANQIKNDSDQQHLYYGSKWATDEELRHMISNNFNNNRYSYYYVIDNPNLKQTHLDLMLNSNEAHIRAAAAKHKNATTEQLDRALNDKEEHVRMNAAINQNINENQLDKAILDSSGVRMNAASNTNIKRHQLLNLLQDKLLHVRKTAKANPKYKQYFPNGHENA